MLTRAATARAAALLLAETDSIEQSSNSDRVLLPRASQWQGETRTSRAGFGTDIAEGALVDSSRVEVKLSNFAEPTQKKLPETEKKLSDTGSDKKPFENSPLSASGKRKRSAAKVKKEKFINGEAVSGGWDKLPHNLGSVETTVEDQKFVNGKAVSSVIVDVENSVTVSDLNPAIVGLFQHVEESVDKLVDIVDLPVRKIKKGKANPYGLTPGESPFPDFAMPTAEACKEVRDLLTEAHGSVEPPKEIPPPSLDVTGCGEVPSVLDAMIRTRLSASTTTTNAKYAFQGLVERYGILKEGIGMGSVDWNKVRESDVTEIENAIKRGGLAKTKSISIKSILEMVHEINISRCDAFLRERTTGDPANVVGADHMTQTQKDMEIEMAEKQILSLQFIHHLDSDKAMTEFVKFPGIGVKTASCIILFCLQRPSFAVDTHVHRLCRWLKWIPDNSTRDQAFSHCEIRIPNAMKYSLHQLFIRHGKTCGRCRAATGEGGEDWMATVCPIEHLVTRTGKRKAAAPSESGTVTKRQRLSKGANAVDGDLETEDAGTKEPEA